MNNKPKTLEELFKDYYGNYKPNLEWEDLSDDIMEEYKDAYETLAKGEEQMISNQKEKRVWTLDEVLDLFGTSFNAYDKEYLTLLAIKNKGDWDDINEDLHNRIRVEDYLNRESVLLNLYHSDVKVVTIFEDEYPAILKQSYKPPFVLFYTGDLKLAEKAIDSSGIMGQEFLAEVILDEGLPVTLIGKEQIEITTPDSFLFVSTTFGGGMTEREQARLFLQLSKHVYFDNAPERKLVTLVMMLASKFKVKIFSKRTEWIKEVAGDNIEFVDFFDGTI